MSDLIDRQEAIEYVLNLIEVNKYYHPHSKAKNFPIDEVVESLKIVPSVDAVQVVRCGECRHKCGEYDGYICCDKNVWRAPDWYCADGERREG